MTTELQSNVLSAGTIKKVMPACLIYALVQSLTFTVDTVIAGHFLDDDAVAAVALGIPVIGFMLSVTTAILHGGFHKMLHCMGQSNMNGYHRIYSLALTLTVIIDLIFIAVCFIFTDLMIDLGGGVKASEQAVEYARIYIRTDCPVILFFSIATLFQLVVTSFGYQTERMICSIVNVGVNIAVSVIAVTTLPAEFRIAGLGIGSAAAAFAQMIAAFIMMKLRKISVKFRFYAPSRKNIKDALDCIRRGLPSSAEHIFESVGSSVVNNIILMTFSNGTLVLALVSIIKSLGGVVRTVSQATMYSSEPLFGILSAGRDKEGIRKTFAASIKLGLIYSSVLAITLIILRDPLLIFFNLDNSENAIIGYVLIALSGIISVFPFTLTSLYESNDHLLLAVIVSVVPQSILFPLLVAILGKPFGVTGIWIAYGYNFVIFFAFYYLILAIIHKRFPVKTDDFLKLGNIKERNTVLDVSIPTDAESVTFVAETLQEFFDNNSIPKKTSYISALCMEEIAADYLDHRKKHGDPKKKSYMDIKAFCDNGKIELILRNYDSPYDPLIFDRKTDTVSKIGVTMVQRVAHSITYSYSYHLNIVTVIIS